MALEAWLREIGQEQAALARDLGLSRALMSAYVRGVRVPKVGTATELQRRSKGRIRLQEWRIPADVPGEEAPPRTPTTTQLHVAIAQQQRQLRRRPI